MKTLSQSVKKNVLVYFRLFKHLDLLYCTPDGSVYMPDELPQALSKEQANHIVSIHRQDLLEWNEKASLLATP